jgi:hypothetical protein
VVETTKEMDLLGGEWKASRQLPKTQVPAELRASSQTKQ